uniref:Uncharacterized protein n=1 Tax=Neogobius melanostomus TaxID=47308 RepID=A0A8C6TC70_9GOBI
MISARGNTTRRLRQPLTSYLCNGEQGKQTSFSSLASFLPLFWVTDDTSLERPQYLATTRQRTLLIPFYKGDTEHWYLEGPTFYEVLSLVAALSY